MRVSCEPGACTKQVDGLPIGCLLLAMLLALGCGRNPVVRLQWPPSSHRAWRLDRHLVANDSSSGVQVGVLSIVLGICIRCD